MVDDHEIKNLNRQRIDKFQRGIYAVQITGKLPVEVREIYVHPRFKKCYWIKESNTELEMELLKIDEKGLGP
jgi:hypothetical protein